jgi:2-methylcitrate dehydratase PrpD
MRVPDTSLTERLDALTRREVTAADRARAALHLLDWIGCAVAGTATETGRGWLSVTASDRPFALTGPEGALAMGGLGSLLEMDDVHRRALLHPGPVVMPAVLALAKEAAAERMLAAILAGYEAMIRLGRAVGAGHYAMFHNTATCGGIGAALAAARMLDLPPEQTVWAAGHAMSLAGGMWQCRNEPGMTKHLHVAEAARRGVQAALLAQAGLAGPRQVLDGPQGFFAALAPSGAPEEVARGSEGWLIGEVSFKPWPACRHAHPAIDAALALRARIGTRPVAGVRVATYADAVLFCDRPDPRTPAEAKFSLQHAVAVALAKGPPELSDFDAPRAAPPAVAGLRRTIQVATEDRFTAAYPAHFGARVDVTLEGGETLSAAVTDAWGDPDVPMDTAAVGAKFDALCRAGGLGTAETSTIRTAVLALPEGGTTEPLRAAVSALRLPRDRG